MNHAIQQYNTINEEEEEEEKCTKCTARCPSKMWTKYMRPDFV